MSPASNSPGLGLLSRVLPAWVAASPRGCSRLPWGSFPFGACDRGSPRARVCLIRALRPQGSSALSAPSFCHDLHGPVSCRARPWGLSHSELFPSRGGNASLDAPLPSCRWLYGARLPPCPSPGCRALLPPEVRRTTAERSRRAARCSLGLPPLQGVLPVRDGPWLPKGRLSRAWAASPLPRVSIASGPVRLRRDHRPS